MVSIEIPGILSDLDLVDNCHAIGHLYSVNDEEASIVIPAGISHQD